MNNYLETFSQKADKGARITINLPALARRDRKFMECWVSDPGHSFVSQDVIALEPSITAHFTQDKNYRWATVDGIGKGVYLHPTQGHLMIDDIYLMVASILPPTQWQIIDAYRQGLFDLWIPEPDTVKKELKRPRTISKIGTLGILYGMGIKKLQTTLQEAGTALSLAETKQVRQSYWGLFPGLKSFMETLQTRVEKDGYLVNPFWYRLTPEPHKAFNAYIQSTASGVLDLYCKLLFEAAPWLLFVAIIHDEVIFQCPDERLKEMTQASEKACKDLNEILAWTVPIRFGQIISKNFAAFKES